MALSHGAGFAARLFAVDPEGMARIFVEGMKHKGSFFFHVCTSCVTFDKQFKTWDHLKKWTHPLPSGHDASDRKKAFNLVLDDDFCMEILHRR